MDIRTILKHGTPRRESELLLAHVLKKPREFLIAHPELNISKIQEIRYAYLSWKLRRGYPLAYLTGHREFYGLDFLVNKHTLVPRPETELMVELAAQAIKSHKLKVKSCVLIDVGTGSGCIPISIQRTLNKKQGASECIAVDISKPALRIAKKNAKKHAVDITFLHGNLLQPLTNQRSLITDHCSLIITANLPYLTQAQFDSEASIQKEPHSALVADDNGLALYKKLLQQIKLLIANYRPSITLFMEIDPAQAKPLTSHCKEQFPHGTLETHKDLLGHNRIISLTL
jgi:release factor glutamine methyltransferase